VLTANRPPDLNLVVNTHPDADHLQGLLFPLASFRVKAFARGPETDVRATLTMDRRNVILRQRGLAQRVVQAGDTLTLSENLRLEVLHPFSGMSGKASSNEATLVLRLVHGSKPLALVCGDVERRGIASLLASGRDLRAEVLVLPHHGSAGSFRPPLYNAVRPSLALAACGYANTWHFPAARVRHALAALHIPLAATADRGQIRVEWREGAPMRVFFARGE
jgi:competence protein ComEC